MISYNFNIISMSYLDQLKNLKIEQACMFFNQIVTQYHKCVFNNIKYDVLHDNYYYDGICIINESAIDIQVKTYTEQRLLRFLSNNGLKEITFKYEVHLDGNKIITEFLDYGKPPHYASNNISPIQINNS